MRLFIWIIVIIISFLSFPIHGHAAVNVSAQHAILIEQSSGRVLFEKNAEEPASIASITKIMTAIIAVESGKMNEQATVSRNAIYTEGSSIYLEQGEKMKLTDLVYGLMLRSGNDAAVAIAEHVGGSEEGFVYLMNEKAKWLGMENTHFDNPHGLDSDTHYSSAHDMAILMQYAMENPIFQEISGETSYLSENRTYHWQNKNKLLTYFYEYCTGGKTGYTKQTGRTLITTAEKDGMELIAVTLDAPNDWQDHISMFEWGFDQFEMKEIDMNGETITNRETTKDTVQVPLYKNRHDDWAKDVYLEQNRPVLQTSNAHHVHHEEDLLSEVMHVFHSIIRWDAND
ncbi:MULTISPECIES: D-alanyl-D-alanine carboxypeptidase family protein [Oceanobacillus]|uniref:D-alanyl-D-alanine carboxypeptidase DacB n=2 Tax=Oceanobacillus TaxID=182709 RepID=A0A0A1MW64_9BACI|nr:D-alanyl-D-alanine carboxypeptidase family protein [Oceanobacillus oncorhynchi]MDM8101640.1 D-alanyl-D-alanine carboxypeptidase family protein [Oceanobacillus oncorhynchi]CEI83789.1 D-alanyl-D-alanine carboxypeptidase DacB precursor [Oceanobacillus oncorhynchi]